MLAGLQLTDAVLVFDAQTLGGISFGGIAFDGFLETGQRRFVGCEPGLTFFMFARIVIFDAKPADQRWKAEPLNDQRCEYHNERKKYNQVAVWKRRAVFYRQRESQGRGERNDASHSRPCNYGHMTPGRIRVARASVLKEQSWQIRGGKNPKNAHNENRDTD